MAGASQHVQNPRLNPQYAKQNGFYVLILNINYSSTKLFKRFYQHFGAYSLMENVKYYKQDTVVYACDRS
jgi:hypothetical protein